MNAAKNLLSDSKSIIVSGAVGLGAWLGNPKEAIADVAKTAYEFSFFADIADAFRIKDAGAGSAFYGPGTPYRTYQDYSQSTGHGGSSGGANGGFLLYPNKPNNNMMQSVYSK